MYRFCRYFGDICSQNGITYIHFQAAIMHVQTFTNMSPMNQLGEVGPDGSNGYRDVSIRVLDAVKSLQEKVFTIHCCNVARDVIGLIEGSRPCISLDQKCH